MNWAALEFGFEWEDPPAESMRQLASELVEMARARGTQPAICAQRDCLVPGAADARCIDAQRLESVAGGVIKAERRGGRWECGCRASKDIGDYDTYPHGCVCCDSVINWQLAQARFHQHDPQGEFLFPTHDAVENVADEGMQRLPPFFFDDAVADRG